MADSYLASVSYSASEPVGGRRLGDALFPTKVRVARLISNSRDAIRRKGRGGKFRRRDPAANSGSAAGSFYGAFGSGVWSHIATPPRSNQIPYRPVVSPEACVAAFGCSVGDVGKSPQRGRAIAQLGALKRNWRRLLKLSCRPTKREGTTQSKAMRAPRSPRSERVSHASAERCSTFATLILRRASQNRPISPTRLANDGVILRCSIGHALHECKNRPDGD